MDFLRNLLRKRKQVAAPGRPIVSPERLVLTAANLREGLGMVGLSRVAQELESLAAPCIRFTTARTKEEDVPLGSSKVGGCPHLPSEMVWPTWKELPLAFVAQINLADLSEYEFMGALPSSGILYYFYHPEQETWGFDPADIGSWRVIFSQAGESSLVQCEPLTTLPDYAQFPVCEVSFRQTLSFPPCESMAIDALRLDDEEVDAYFRILEVLNEGTDSGTLHQLLGHPDVIQGDMQLECQLVSHGLYCGDTSGYRDPRRRELERGVQSWRLLLQLDSDDEANMMWGDCGRLYFWIHEDALAARDFDKVWMVLQCF
jgi:uncharacterized protein YwqG